MKYVNLPVFLCHSQIRRDYMSNKKKIIKKLKPVLKSSFKNKSYTTYHENFTPDIWKITKEILRKRRL